MKKNNIMYSVITGLLFIIGIFIGMHVGASHNTGETQHKTMKHDMMDHGSMDHSMMDPMQMSMADMGTMLEGKTGDDLDKAFLEGMIPHHQGAIDMAAYLVNAKHPELKKMGEEIIATQQAEIDQMNAWLVEWGYKN